MKYHQHYLGRSDFLPGLGMFGMRFLYQDSDYTRQWDNELGKISKGPDQNDDAICSQVISQIKQTIRSSPRFQNTRLKIYAKGSYRSRTNIRKNSDLDICVEYEDVYSFGSDYPALTNFYERRQPLSDYTLLDFNRDLIQAIKPLGKIEPQRIANCIVFKKPGISVDIVGAFPYRHYIGLGDRQFRLGAVVLDRDTRSLIANWPEQDYVNGLAKHKATNRNYKRYVRCFKALKERMQNDRIESATRMKSFLIESLLYNCPNKFFEVRPCYRSVMALLSYLNQILMGWDRLRLVEVNGIKPLFGAQQRWNVQDVRQFVVDLCDFLKK